MDQYEDDERVFFGVQECRPTKRYFEDSNFCNDAFEKPVGK